MADTHPSSSATLNPVAALRQHGQSVWLDFIRRSLITGGELKRLVDEDGLGGVTSNPAIFEKAIDGSDDYKDAIAELSADVSLSPKDVFERLAIKDIQDAADVLRVVYDRTHTRGRLREPRGRAGSGARHRGHDRRGEAAVEGGEPAERDDQDSGHPRGRAGDPDVSDRRHQHQYHAALRAVGATKTSPPRIWTRSKRAWPRASPSITSAASRVSSSAASTRWWTR